MSSSAGPAGPPGEPVDWPGRSLGLPERGAGSLARVGPRVLALVIDWAACSLVSAAFFGYDPTATLLVFAVEQVLLVGLVGGSFGHVLLRLRVHRFAGATRTAAGGSRVGPTPPGPLPALLRTALLVLVVPALIPDTHGRAVHDRAAGTVLLRR